MPRSFARLYIDRVHERCGGESQIVHMRDRMQGKLKDQYNEQEFHDRLLAYGNMPPSVIEKQLVKVWVRSDFHRPQLPLRQQGVSPLASRTCERDSCAQVHGPGDIFRGDRRAAGLNGAGKTTAIKLALGLLFPTGGEVKICGLPASDPGALRRVGFLPELPYFYSFMSAREALRFYGRLSLVPEKELEERVASCLDRVGLGAQKNRKIGDFSKGMLQKLGLAQAILHSPELLLLDEPVSGLDPLPSWRCVSCSQP